MGTFTIYNCGTNYDETKKQEAVASLYSRTKGARGVSKLICAGPGSTLMTRPGYDPAKEPGEYEFSKANVFKGLYQGLGQISGALSGAKQVEFNVNRVMEILAGLPDPKPGMINMAGWSRGACTCHAMANAMNRSKNPYLKGVPVNIFAFDPVPGTNNLSIADWTVIPPNVANYSCIFMENEYRRIMHSAYLTFKSNNTRRKLLSLPGRHCYGVEETKNFPEVAKIGFHLSEDFLEEWGTVFTESHKLQPVDVLENYAAMILNTPNFFSKEKAVGGNSDGWTRWGGNHGAWVTVDNHLLSNSPYFINSHHKRVFRQRFPIVFRYYFEMGIFPESKSSAVYLERSMEKLVYDRQIRRSLEDQLLEMMRSAPRTHESLHHFAESISMPGTMKTTQQGFGQKAKNLQFGKRPDEDMSESFANLFKAA
jgi:hypothetical protein